MDRLILIDSREAYNIDELNAHEARLEYEEWLMATDPMDAWIDASIPWSATCWRSNPMDAWIDAMESSVSDEEIFSVERN